jgi:hypothetical protein
MFRTLLFDVDGTLIDSNGAHAEAWTTAMREYGVEVNVDQIRRMIGMGGDKILPAIAHVSEDSDQGQSITRRKKQIFNSLLPSCSRHTARGRSWNICAINTSIWLSPRRLMIVRWRRCSSARGSPI